MNTMKRVKFVALFLVLSLTEPIQQFSLVDSTTIDYSIINLFRIDKTIDRTISQKKEQS